MDRQAFANEFQLHGVTLTDELWAKITPRLGDFDGYVGDTKGSP